MLGQLDRTAQDTVFLHGVALVLAQRPWATTVAEGSEELLHPWSLVLVDNGNISQIPQTTFAKDDANCA